MPPISAFPKSHQVTFNYYVGLIHFLEEDYVTAEKHLSDAYNQSLRNSPTHTKLILTYLIPTKLLTTQVLPTDALLAPYPSLQKLFAPIASCIRKGDLAGFDAALRAGEDELVRLRVYLTLERGRDTCMRNLFRKVYLAGGFEVSKDGSSDEKVRRSRIPLSEFAAALSIGGEKEIERDEVECLVANLIYKVSIVSEWYTPVLMDPAEHDERLHFTRSSTRCSQQEGVCLSGHWSLKTTPGFSNATYTRYRRHLRRIMSRD